jgi:hypothetical protein
MKGDGLKTLVAYLRAADNYDEPLAIRLKVVISRSSALSQRVFNTPLDPLGRYLSRSQPFQLTIINRRCGLDRLRLGPRRHPIEQHFFE